MAPNPNFFCPVAPVVPVEEVEDDAAKADDRDQEYVFALSAELAEMAKTDLGEDEEVRVQGLRDLRVWIRSRRHRCRTDAVFLLRFLRSQKFRLDRTCAVLDNYLKMRADNPDWFANLDPTLPLVAEMTDSGLATVLPGRDAAGRKVVLSYAAKVDTARHTNADVMRATMASLETLMEDEENQIRGVTYIFYCKGLSFSHCSIWTPSDASRLFGACEKNLAVRHSDINLVRLPFTMWAVVEFVKQFLSAKIKSRIHVHSDEKKLLKKLDATQVPKELGGDADRSLAQMGAEWRAAMTANRDKLLALDDMAYGDAVAASSGGLWSYIPGM